MSKRVQRPLMYNHDRAGEMITGPVHFWSLNVHQNYPHVVTGRSTLHAIASVSFDLRVSSIRKSK